MDLWAFAPDAPEAASRIASGLAALPRDPGERKRAKPDLEALVRLPAGELLALGSGATERRHRGVLWRDGSAREIDLSALHATLARDIAHLNLEGAVVRGDELVLVQRGNGPDAASALVSLDLGRALAGLADGAVTGDGLRAVVEVDVGAALALTDAVVLPDGRLLATAAAEAGESTYEDGPVSAAAVVTLDRRDRVERVSPLDRPWKVEGIELLDDGEPVLVADADDPRRRAPVLRARMDP